jgi:hypothetical protein
VPLRSAQSPDTARLRGGAAKDRWGSERDTAAVTESNERDVSHFTQSNPIGPGQGDVGALLRRVADAIDRLGDVQIRDITFRSDITDGEDDVRFTVYFNEVPRRR